MSDFREKYKLSDEKLENVGKAVKKRRDLTTQLDAYSEFVESQKKYFLDNIDTVLEILTNLIMDGKLFIHTKLIGRIKDSESAIYNDDELSFEKKNIMGAVLAQLDTSDYSILPAAKEEKTGKKTKKLDDVFGITIIADTQKEIDVLREELRKHFNIRKDENKDKEQYHAIHMQIYGNGEQSPLVECQLKTRQSYIDSYDHTLYKVETNLTRKLYSQGIIDEDRKVRLNENGIKKVDNIVQQFYDGDGFNIFSNIPRMWEATFSEEDEKMKLKRLTAAQTLKRVYPSLRIHPEKTR